MAHRLPKGVVCAVCHLRPCACQWRHEQVALEAHRGHPPPASYYKIVVHHWPLEAQDQIRGEGEEPLGEALSLAIR
jgi:hypothetical protein